LTDREKQVLDLILQARSNREIARYEKDTCFDLSLFHASITAFAASTREDLQARIDAAKVVLDQIMAAQDNSIPMNILEQATCVGVVPGMIKGALSWRAVWPGRGDLPHRPRLERAGLHSHGGRVVRLSDRRPVHGPGAGCGE
jgi:hypothetical protein